MRRQVDKKVLVGSAAVCALAAALFGCGGNAISGTGGTTGGVVTTTGGGAFGADVATVNLPDAPGLLQYSFLTGAGRAGGFESATVRNLAVTGNNGAESSGLSERRLTLTSYQSQMLPTNIPGNGLQSRLFSNVQLNFTNYTFNDGTASTDFTDVDGAPVDVSSLIRTYNGRQTNVPIYMDGDTINVVSTGGTPFAQFNAAWFNQINQVAGDSVVVRGYLSDFISFDVSGLTDRPALSNGFGVADRVMFSGDGYAMANGNAVAGGAPFELIYPGGQAASVIGRHTAPGTLPNGTPVTNTPGSYTTVGIDPSDVTTTDPVLARKITALQGIWKPHFSQRLNNFSGQVEDLGYLKNLHAFEAISIPSSLDNERQDVVFMTQTITNNGDGTKSARITGFMWGYLDLENNQIKIYPLANLTDVDTGTNRNGEVVYNITGKFLADGTATVSSQQMRYLTFSRVSGAPTAAFPATGKIVVVRK